MPKHRNILACLVHESPACVVDLVRNLHCLHPESPILLYDGGPNRTLLANGFPFERYGAIIHPAPRPMAWGRLHGFALDCIEFARVNLDFDTITIVDSDQLALRSGFDDALARDLAKHPRCGVMGSTSERHGPSSTCGPVRAAWAEIDLWKPFLNRFPDGESHFVHWTFWPSTVLAREAAIAIADLFARDSQFNAILAASQLWATEEVLFPTLAALLGFDVRVSPGSYRYVRFRERYAIQDAEAALHNTDAFWIHPVPRLPDDPLRKHIRYRHGEYQLRHKEKFPVTKQATPLLLTLPVLEKMRRVEGWLEDSEGDLLFAASMRAASKYGATAAMVEIGSYCGRSTVVIASVLAALCPEARLYAIDPHEGKVGSADTSLQTGAPTMERFLHNINTAGVRHVIEPVASFSSEVEWDRPISLLFIDGLHDYDNVARDFFHFEAHVVEGGLIAFHDYAHYYPGVKTFVDELLAGGSYRVVALACSLIVVEKVVLSPRTPVDDDLTSVKIEATDTPLVSCLMATWNRRALAPKAISYFLRQDYPNAELLVIDDGSDPISDLLPPDPRIRYIRLERRHSLGQKHNIGCENARGEILLHWDDDDWMSADRITRQVQHLRGLDGPALTGLAKLLFFDPRGRRAWEYVYPESAQPWVAGGTFCYPKSLWIEHRFEDISEGVDTRFAWNLRRAPVRPLADHYFYVAMVHAGNISPKRTQDPRWHPISTETLRGILGSDWNFYEDFPLDARNGRVSQVR